MPRYCANLKATRYESTSLNRIVADKSQRVIVAYDKYQNFTVKAASQAMADEKIADYRATDRWRPWFELPGQ